MKTKPVKKAAPKRAPQSAPAPAVSGSQSINIADCVPGTFQALSGHHAK